MDFPGGLPLQTSLDTIKIHRYVIMKHFFFSIFRQCASKSECYSSQPCRDVKLHLWRKRPGLLVEPSCRPQCCASDLCNHPVATPDLIKSSTYKNVPTSAVRTTPKKCFEFEPEFVSKLDRRKPREKRCSKNGAFDSCFTLQAQVLDATTQRVTEIAEWKDCATESRDCHAIANRCTMLQELAKNRGAHVKNCTVSCCREDLCNARTSFPANIQLEIEGNSASQLKGICGISVLSSVLVFLNSQL